MARRIWNWQQDDWPDIPYAEACLQEEERAGLMQSGLSLGVACHIGDAERLRLKD